MHDRIELPDAVRALERAAKNRTHPNSLMDSLGRQREYVINGWRIEPVGAGLPAQPGQVERIIQDVVGVIEDARGLYYRSLHAATYLTRIDGVAGEAVELYVKTYNPTRGVAALKERIRGGRASNVLRMTAALQRNGFNTAQVVLKGVHDGSGQTMLTSVRAEGVSLPELTQRGDGSMARKRALIRALGTEVARLHRCGFVHGDLTPYNIFVAQQEPPRFIFLDNDRTRAGFPAGRRYRQLRNLVQLGRFELPGLSNTDRLRFFHAYAAGCGPVRERAMLRRVAGMLARRKRKDAG
ncbi:MAG: lipopolysaccharide kinase InaA family protein [Candidatus Binataceae bacterium]